MNAPVQHSFLNHLCDEEPDFMAVKMLQEFLNHLCDEEPADRQSFCAFFLNHLCDEEPPLSLLCGQ